MSRVRLPRFDVACQAPDCLFVGGGSLAGVRDPRIRPDRADSVDPTRNWLQATAVYPCTYILHTSPQSVRIVTTIVWHTLGKESWCI